MHNPKRRRYCSIRICLGSMGSSIHRSRKEVRAHVSARRGRSASQGYASGRIRRHKSLQYEGGLVTRSIPLRKISNSFRVADDSWAVGSRYQIQGNWSICPASARARYRGYDDQGYPRRERANKTSRIHNVSVDDSFGLDKGRDSCLRCPLETRTALSTLSCILPPTRCGRT